MKNLMRYKARHVPTFVKHQIFANTRLRMTLFWMVLATSLASLGFSRKQLS